MCKTLRCSDGYVNAILSHLICWETYCERGRIALTWLFKTETDKVDMKIHGLWKTTTMWNMNINISSRNRTKQVLTHLEDAAGMEPIVTCPTGFGGQTSIDHGDDWVANLKNKLTLSQTEAIEGPFAADTYLHRLPHPRSEEKHSSWTVRGLLRLTRSWRCEEVRVSLCPASRQQGGFLLEWRSYVEWTATKPATWLLEPQLF